MSDRATTWAWQQAPSSDKAWLALILLANNADDEGLFTVRRADFAKMLRCSVDTFDRRVNSLVSDGLLKVEVVMSQRGRRPNTYALAIPKEFARQSSSRKTAAPDSHKTAASSSRKTSTPTETSEQNGAAAELRLAATGAAAIKDSKLNTETLELGGESRDKRARRAPKPKAPFDPRWKSLSPENREYAVAKGLYNGYPDEEFENFRDYHLKNASLSADWHASWRTWVRNAVKFRAEKETGANAQRHRSTPNDNRRARHRTLAKVLEARKLVGHGEGDQLLLEPPRTQ